MPISEIDEGPTTAEYLVRMVNECIRALNTIEAGKQSASPCNKAMVQCQKHIEYRSYFGMLRYRLCPYCGFDLAQHH